MIKKNHDRDTIASSAMAIASTEEREAYIAQACGNDTQLRRQVEERLATRSQADNPEEPARTADNGSSSPEQPPQQAGTNHPEGREAPITRIGPYKVLKQAGEGVAGIVFQAEQQEPVRLPVAVKVIKEGRDWRQIIARFEAKRQVLLRMDHPNIAKLFGAGTRQAGQPYFVTEWIEGVPLTKYCDEHQLSLQQRLELFIPVCQAVQYAHQQGVLHGNLKPSNVLVAKHDDKPAPKVLDIGVSESVRRRPIEGTSSGQPPDIGGNLEYVSPEQADANREDIDTRSDVYSLGVLLYELLTGTPPLGRQHLTEVSRTEALRLIREEEIPLPSKRLSESKDGLASTAAQRQMKPAALLKAVRGDLDCLVMKALQKDRTHRYQTANELARDIQRYLDNEPPEACPPSTRKQLWRIGRQHPRLLVAAVVVFLLLVAAAITGGGLTAWALRKEGQAQKAEQEAVEKSKKAQKAEEETKGKLHRTEAARKATEKERDQAKAEKKAVQRSEEDTKAIVAFFRDKLMSAGRPSDVSLTEAFWAKGQNKDVTLRQAVDAAETRVAEAFADRPLAEATVREILGSAYLNLGEATRAVQQYKRALALREAEAGANDPDTAECRNKLAVAYRLAGHPDEAGRLFDQNYHSPAHAAALASRGVMLLSQKKPAEAELKLRACLTIRQKIQPDDWTTFETESLLGEALLEQKKYADAEPLLLSGYEGMKHRQSKIPSQGKSRFTKALERLVRLYEAWNKKDQADRWRKELEATEHSQKP